MNAKRLLKLADFLDTMPREKFDFGVVADEQGKPMAEALAADKTQCGTVGCAIGWMPAVFPRGLEWTRSTERMWTGPLKRTRVALVGSPRTKDFAAAAEWFDISELEAEALFMPDSAGFGLRAISERAGPTVVARRIRRFVERRS